MLPAAFSTVVLFEQVLRVLSSLCWSKILVGRRWLRPHTCAWSRSGSWRAPALSDDLFSSQSALWSSLKNSSNFWEKWKAISVPGSGNVEGSLELDLG